MTRDSGRGSVTSYRRTRTAHGLLAGGPRRNVRKRLDATLHSVFVGCVERTKQDGAFHAPYQSATTRHYTPDNPRRRQNSVRSTDRR
jgi:hypothetical protein